MSGKGSRPRPFSVDRETFESNWDRVFNKSKVQKEIDQLRGLKDNRSDGDRQSQAWLKNEYYDLDNVINKKDLDSKN